MVAAAAAFGVTASLLATVAPAYAEPVSPSYVIVGSDTLQDVVNALTNGTSVTGSSVRSTAGKNNVASYDATGSVLIQTKTGGPLFGRPNGSGDGVKALSRSIDNGDYKAGSPGSPTVKILNQVDIARSSSGATEVTNGALRYIPFGRDALSYAYKSTDVAFEHITEAQLKSLFECTTTTIGTTTAVPVIPQAGSGTRKDFLGKIGVTEQTLGACVKVGQEHDTQKLSDGTLFPTNGVTAMSAAQWVAQNTGAGINRIGAGVKIGSPIGVSPTSGVGGSTEPNKAYYDDSHWGRDTYLVVENARVTVGDAKYSADLANLVSTATSKLGNTSTTLISQAGSVKKKFGFLPPSNTTPFRAALQ
ncbi:hypothetical protein [Diaminobutyricimonas sp. LJ205]|uniref:hypothetical protein n=1 Tax=Diaminobutyricimonas sp. LJ205 TaxID=2683590 RepID=UPI0012F4B939|nr:hypothetical protein [Diaminobutyricimonas sp. LJ205]